MPVPSAKPVAVPDVSDAVHEYVTVAPVMVVVKAILVGVPWHTVCNAGVAITCGVGCTVT